MEAASDKLVDIIYKVKGQLLICGRYACTSVMQYQDLPQ
jgi:hypothetical protein